MLTTEMASAMIKEAIDELNAERQGGARLVFAEDLVLFGPDSALDSLDFVNFVAVLQDRLSAHVGHDVDLTAAVFDESANLPFRSVAALIHYLGSLPDTTPA